VKIDPENKELDREVKRRIEIVVQVFSQAANKLTKVDRDWQQVLDS